MERVIGNEYCCAISPPSAPDFCLHIALFYCRCDRAGQPIRSSAVALASPPPTPPPAAARHAAAAAAHAGLLPRAAADAGAAHGPVRRVPPHLRGRRQYRRRQRPWPRPPQPPLHRLFVETGLAGPVRGLYLDVTGSPETGMRYSEMPGDDPERAAAAAVAVATSPPPSAFSSSTASPAITTTPSSSAPSSPAGANLAPRALQTKTFIGTIAAEDFDRFREICRHIQPPPC
ncbi:hypothetical protein G6O67_000035 [Ophiocordyceps sinensis]|uniref:Uncharacterized protein n=1 Tax=Ophiocordyceps sinensis TaxID=72228 RepID=A0A8H4PYD9_9HYPO|nr:hypothetical protein G6O67_000035 [Ophiocordyceps sinensis]